MDQNDLPGIASEAEALALLGRLLKARAVKVGPAEGRAELDALIRTPSGTYAVEVKTASTARSRMFSAALPWA